MKILKYIIIVSFAVLLAGSAAYSQVFSFESASNEYTATFPRGTLIRATIQETISTKENKVGDPVSFVVISDMTIGKVTCIPKDSFIYGQVIRLEQAKQGRDGFFQILVDKIVFPDGWHTQLAGKIWTKDGSGVIGGGITQKQDFKKIPHNIEHIGPVVQLVRTGERKMGQQRSVLGGTELIIVLDSDLQVKYLEGID